MLEKFSMLFSAQANSQSIEHHPGAHRVLTKGEPPSKLVAYIFMIILFGALIFFVYNWWRCRQSRVLEQEADDFGAEFGQENSFKASKPYHQGNLGPRRANFDREDEDKSNKEI